MSGSISWIHFGDLHITDRDEQNLRDFQALIEEANRYMTKDVAFALLPGDNADDGERDEYELVREAIAHCRLPVHAITGDHDVASGSLDMFEEYLAPSPYRSFSIGGYHFVLVNSVAAWNPPEFGLGREQMDWLRRDLRGSRNVIVMHAYPAEHGADAQGLGALIRDNRVLLVEMGHTHYNELANDGHTIYATTRSTGQVEEGPPGFSVTTIDDDVVSWRFKPLGEWPLVMITSPADERLITDAASRNQVVRGKIPIRARAWGPEIRSVQVTVDGGNPREMTRDDDQTWSQDWETRTVGDGVHVLRVEAVGIENGADEIRVLVNQSGQYQAPARSQIDYENVLGAWPEKHITGTQLGPNENGRHWPRRQRAVR
jgi:3',5'-cyclic AMP phosphodiesterase CpdA